ncbi:MAG: HPr family phosphocarrier protein [Myxococcales bacterium]|nr:HPr family phosphocarrier protein [Myxococcales bacterium]
MNDQGTTAGPGALRRKAKIRNKLGMHARAAVKFVQLAARFESEIFVEKEGEQVNGKSIMGLLTLVAAHGMEIEILAEGADASEAVDQLFALVDSGFGEGVAD